MTDVVKLMDLWAILRVNADTEIKRLRKQVKKPSKKSTSKDPPTPAQLLAALESAFDDLTTAVENHTAAASNVQDALAVEAAAEENVVAARSIYDAANKAYVASLLPVPPE